MKVRNAPNAYFSEKMPIGTTVDDLWFQSLVRTFKLAMSSTKLKSPMTQNVWVYACVASWSRNISAVPFTLMSGNQTTGEAQAVTDGDIPKLMANPNPLMPSSLFWQAIVTAMALYGETIIVMEGANDDRLSPGELPSELWPMPPSAFEHKVDKETALISKWVYTSGSSKIEYAPHEILHVRFWNPNDFYRGLAPLKAALMGIQQDWSSAIYNKAFFDHGADPGGILSTEQPLNENQAKRELARYEGRHGGADKAKRIALLTRGLKYESLSSNRREMEFLEGRKWNRAEVMAAFGTPPTELGIVEDVNRETSKTLRKQYWENHLLPVMRVVQAFFNSDAFLGGLRDTSVTRSSSLFFEWDTSEVKALQEDMEALLERAKSLRDLGVPLNTINETLGLGLPDNIEGADVAYVPNNLVPVGMVGVEPPANGDDERIAGPTRRKMIPAVVRDEAEAAAEEEDDDEAEKRETDEVWQRFLARVFRPEERRWIPKIRRYFGKLRTEQLRRFDAAVTLDEPVAANVDEGLTVFKQSITAEEVELLMFNRRDWDEALQRVAEPLMRGTVETALGVLETELGGFSVFGGPTDPSVLRFMSERLPKLAGDVNGTVSRRVRTSLLRGLAENEEVDDLRKRIRREFNFANKRALAIARTEVGIATNGSRFRAMRQEVAKHRWITSGDEHVRASHAMNNNDVVDVGQPFDNGLLYPSDPNGPPEEIINCRCVAVPEVTA